MDKEKKESKGEEKEKSDIDEIMKAFLSVQEKLRNLGFVTSPESVSISDLRSGILLELHSGKKSVDELAELSMGSYERLLNRSERFLRGYIN